MDWITLPGSVSYSRMHPKDRIASTEELREMRGVGSRVVSNSRLIFEFNYTVAGHSYASRRFYVWGRPSADRAVREYAVGQHLTARYNPEDPAEAVVEPGNVGHSLLIGSIVSLGLAALAISHNVQRK